MDNKSIIGRYLLFFLVVLMTVSCVKHSKYKALSTQCDSLIIINNEQARQMDKLQLLIEEISNSLDSISAQEKILFLPDPESNSKSLSKKEKIKRLESFQDLIIRQHDRICELEKEVNADSLELSNLHSIISFLSNQIKEKDESISKLKEELIRSQSQVKKLNVKIDDLNTHISSLNDNISNLESVSESQIQALSVQDELLNKAYVCIGNRKDLAQLGVKVGLKTNYASINKSMMGTVDIREFRSVSINSLKVKILTPMPTESYKLKHEGNLTILDIVDSGKFWCNSNVLIIQTDAILPSMQK